MMTLTSFLTLLIPKLLSYLIDDILMANNKEKILPWFMIKMCIRDSICSVETFSRIERGKTKIKGDTYKKIMERLERNTDKFYAVCSGCLLYTSRCV